MVDAQLRLEAVSRDAGRRFHHSRVVHEDMEIRFFRLEPREVVISLNAEYLT